MIVRYPTGLYGDLLQTSQSITYTVSNQDPPRTDLIYAKIPLGVVLKQREPKDEDVVARRNKTFGNLIYTISQASRSLEGNNQSQFEIGQVLEFSVETGKDVDPMLVNPLIEIQHNTNILDLTSLGLTESEQGSLANIVLATQISITNQLNKIKELRYNAEQDVTTSQKQINDLSKAIESLEIALKNAPAYSSLSTELQDLETLIDKLKGERDAAFIKRDNAIQQANTYAGLATGLADELRKVGQLVK
jgi:hypothetical protein